MNLDFSAFSKHLFWDIDVKKPHPDDWRPFLVKRVLEYGLWEDWLQLAQMLDVKEIGEVASQLRELEPKAMTFISLKSGIPVNKFRCYHTKLSTPPHWNF